MVYPEKKKTSLSVSLLLVALCRLAVVWLAERRDHLPVIIVLTAVCGRAKSGSRQRERERVVPRFRFATAPLWFPPSTLSLLSKTNLHTLHKTTHTHTHTHTQLHCCTSCVCAHRKPLASRLDEGPWDTNKWSPMRAQLRITGNPHSGSVPPPYVCLCVDKSVYACVCVNDDKHIQYRPPPLLTFAISLNANIHISVPFK